MIVIEHPRRPIGTGDVLRLDSSPAIGVRAISARRFWIGAQRDELDSRPIELAEFGVGRQFGVEDEFFGEAACPPLPEIHKAEDLVIPLVLGNWALASQKTRVSASSARTPAFRSGSGSAWRCSASRPARPRHRKGIVWKSRSKDVPHRSPRRVTLWNRWASASVEVGDAATVLGEERPLGDRVQAGEQGQPVVEDIAHDSSVAPGAEELQRRQRSMAQAAGIMADPGKPPPASTLSRSAATKSGRNRNSPPNWYGRCAVPH